MSASAHTRTAPDGEAREVFRNATRYYADLFHIRHMDGEKFFHERLELEGLEHLIAARDSGRGVIVVSAHFGNPEIAVQGMASEGFTFFALTEPLQPQALSDFTQWLRSGHGHEYRTLSFGATKEMIRRLKRGGLVAILLDRDVAGTGVPVQFFGAETRMPLGAVDIALRTGAHLIPAWAWRIPGYRFRVEIEPPMELVRTGSFDEDVRTNARRLLELFERRLRADPGQWSVLEPIWREPEHKPAQSGAIQ
ncbi:MAG: lysophospholipid acyltransferase family protein [Nitrospinae bacterium]|nr:lysophospholipid acyltransferase family protein [Nitrospinota bacterium]